VSRDIAASIDTAGGELAIALSGDRVPLASFAGFAPRGAGLDTARATGRLELRRTGDRLARRDRRAVTGLHIDHRRSRPSDRDRGRARRHARDLSDAVALEAGHLQFGAADLTASGWLRRGSPASGQVELRLAPARARICSRRCPASCAARSTAWASPARSAATRASRSISRPRSATAFDLDLDLDNRCTVTAEPPAADATALLAAPPAEVQLRRMRAHVPAAFISAEDARFYDHHGFDSPSDRAQPRDRSARSSPRTRWLDDQPAARQERVPHAAPQPRSQDPGSDPDLAPRSAPRQEQILERYLNIIELGPHVAGVAAAARYWFDTTARELTLRQAAFSPRSPPSRNRCRAAFAHAGGLDPDSAARVDVVLRACAVTARSTRTSSTAPRSAAALHGLGAAPRLRPGLLLAKGRGCRGGWLPRTRSARPY